MPRELAYKNEMQDGRKKLPKSLHPIIKEEYKTIKSQRALAAKYGVSRRLITFILDPAKEKRQKESVKREHRWLKYYTKEKQREYMRKYRAKKRKAGLVVGKGGNVLT
jgi:hypothetical protein